MIIRGVIHHEDTKHTKVGLITSLRDLRALCAFVMMLMMTIGVARAEVVDRVLAVVSGDLILLSDVTAAQAFGLSASPANAPDPTAAVLAQLIDRALILAEVDRYAPPEPSAAAVDERLAAIRARFPTDAAYRAALAHCGYDEPHLRQTIREDLRMAEYLDQRFKAAPRSELDDWVAGLRRRAEIVDLYRLTSAQRPPR